MSSRSGLRARRESEAKRAFFEAAMALFKEKGVEATSVEEIAERAGYSRATFFNHFGAKAGVFRYYGQTLAEQVENVLDGSPAAPSAIEGIRRILFALAREADARKEDLRLVFAHSVGDADYLRAPTPARRRVLETLEGLLARAQEEGSVRADRNARELTFHVFGLYQSTIFAVVWDEARASNMMESVWDLLLDGLAGPGRPRDGGAA